MPQRGLAGDGLLQNLDCEFIPSLLGNLQRRLSRTSHFRRWHPRIQKGLYSFRMALRIAPARAMDPLVSIAMLVLRIEAMGYQEWHYVRAALESRTMHRGITILLRNGDIRFLCEEETHDIRVATEGGHH